MTDLQKAFKRFKDVSDVYKTLYDYYDGDQPLIYSAERLRDAFQAINPQFIENVCVPVIDTVTDRLELYGWSAGDEKLNDALAAVWEHTGLALDSNEIHESALICGEAFLIGWQDEGQPLEFYFNDPRQCAVFYDPDHPKTKAFAAKWWDTDDGVRMVLYYPDHLERYFAPGTKMANLSADSGAGVFLLDSTDVNPYGMIPVFHFRNGLRVAKSELKNVTRLQDAINKLLCDLMVTAEFGAFPARYIISNADIPAMKNSPNQVWDLPAGIGEGQGTQVGTLPAADLSNFSGQIEKLVNAVSFITKIPRHFFESQGANISGEALIAMEAPLVKKAQRKQELFGTVWQEVAVFAAKTMGYDISKTDVMPQWGNPESEQPLTETQILKNYKDSGLSMKTALRLVGYTDSEIEVIEQEQAEEKQALSDLSALYLEAARNRSAREDVI